ncbi:hypothetical protein H7R52_02205 [Weissella confusa]|uniref:Elongation factor G-binding protein N-terminal domain-containing protein n=1 Tax=Weissella confusa TaxID=1583 RepID=A0A923NEG9_WEICO|nr:hypothetical protein [Weissella confusa]
MFLSKVKSRGAEGNYTKRGNLICRDSSLCNAQLSSLDYLASFVETTLLVTPFPELSANQLGKLFKKVKKLPEPKWENMNRHEMTYLGWNDNGSQKKYIVAPRDGKLVGIYGDFKQVIILNKAFNSVNDKNVKSVVQADVIETVKAILPDTDVANEFLAQLPEIALSKQRAEHAFKQLAEHFYIMIELWKTNGVDEDASIWVIVCTPHEG